jgi:ATP-binding cassette subfamily B protein
MMFMQAPAAKSKDFRGSFRRLLGELRPERLLLVAVLALGVISVVFAVIGPKLLGNATNVLFEGVVGKGLPAGFTVEQIIAGLRARGEDNLADMLASMDVTPGVGVDFGALTGILAIVAGVYILSSIFSWAQTYIMAGVTQRTVYRLRRRVDEKLGRLPLAYFDRQSRGDILSRVTNDIDNISNSLQQSLTQLITSVLTVIGVLLIMLTISPLLAFVSILVVPLSILVTVLVAGRSQRQFVAQWQRTGDLNGHIEEMHTGHSIVKLFGRQEEAIAHFDRLNEQLYQASYRAQFISGIIQPAMMFISNLNYVAIAVIGGVRVASGQMSLGDVQAFIQYSRQFTFPIIQAASIANVLQSAVASAERVFELLDEPEEIADPATPAVLPAVEGRVAFEDVAFRYDPDKPLIEDMNLVVEPGRRSPSSARRAPRDDPAQPPHALLRRRRRPHHDRRRRYPAADARRAAAHLRDGPPGRLALPGHHPRQHRLRGRRRADRGAPHGGGRGRPRRPLRADHAGWLRDRPR